MSKRERDDDAAAGDFRNGDVVKYRRVDDDSARARSSVAGVWREIRKTYEATSRDIVQAYRDSDTLAALNGAYGRAQCSRCSIVLITHAEHPALNFYLTHAERLIKKGVVVFSMCWLRQRDDMNGMIVAAEARRQHRATIRNFYVAISHDGGDAIAEDEDEEMDEDEEDAAVTVDTDVTMATMRQRKYPVFEEITNEQYRYGRSNLLSSADDYRSVEMPPREDYENEDDDAAAAAELTADDLAKPGYSSTTFNSEVVKAIHYLRDNEYTGGGVRRGVCDMRNRIFLQFFGKFLYFARSFLICDHTGMSFHKSFSLIDPAVIKSMCTTNE